MTRVDDEVLHTYDEERLVTKHDKAAKRAAKTVVGKHLTVETVDGKLNLSWDWEALHREVVEAIASVSADTAAKTVAKSAAKKSAAKKTPPAKKPAAKKPAAKKPTKTKTAK